jgi:hypothetical protein
MTLTCALASKRKRQKAEVICLLLGILLVGRRANKKRGRSVCEADDFCYRHAAGPASGQRADKRVSSAVGVD